ncbi:MAG: DNA-processing protein DprA [Spirochaetales bacterium]
MKEILSLAIGTIPSLRYSERLRVWEEISTREEFLKLKPLDLSIKFQRTLRNTLWDPFALWEQAEATLQRMQGKDIHLLLPTDSRYPPQLKEIYDPPFLLFYRGVLPAWTETFFAVVGTRNPTPRGRRAAYNFGRESAEAGIVIVSGLAKGIDGEAHRGALDGKGRTLAVLGHGPDTVYPYANRRLGERILSEGGLLLSEYPPGTHPLPYHFPARNRIISGLCRGVLVVEAPKGSGALITADYALEQGRDLFVHRLGVETMEGTRHVSEEGAPIIEGVQDLFSAWGIHRAQGLMDTKEKVGDRKAESLSAGEWLANRLKEELEKTR